MTPPDDQNKQSRIDKIFAITEAMKHLTTGDMARLKRGPLKEGEAGAPAFWQLATRYDFEANEKWAAIIQAMALLAPRSDNGPNFKSPHDKKYRLGRALCDGGDKGWKGGLDARPAFSELRLARLLNARGKQRSDMLLRAIRMIAPARTPVNCIDIANLILNSEEDWPARQIAQDFYWRLSSAETEAAKQTA